MTTIGVIFIITSLLCFGSIEKLLVLLITSSIFEAATLFNVSGGGRSIGLQPYYYVLLVIIVHYILKVKLIRELKIQIPIFLFSMYALIITLLAPAIFSRILVYTPSKGIDVTDVAELEPLSGGISNIVQIIYLALNVIVFILIINDRKVNISAYKSFRSVGILAVIFAVLQIVLPFINISYPYAITNNNEGFAQGYNQASRIFLYRTVSSFTEPSSAGSYFAGLFLFSFVLIVKRIGRFYINALIAILAALIVFASASSTGILTLLISTVVFSIYSVLENLKSKRTSLITLLTYISLAVIISGAVVFIPQIVDIFQDSVVNKSSTISFDNRNRSNFYSLDILSQSYGLGVGVGSNRPSSFLLYLLSNTGVIGTLLFLAFIIQILIVLLRRSEGNQDMLEIPRSEPLIWAFLAILLSKLIAQPDLSQPSFWILILLLGLRINQTKHSRVLKGVDHESTAYFK